MLSLLVYTGLSLVGAYVIGKKISEVGIYRSKSSGLGSWLGTELVVVLLLLWVVSNYGWNVLTIALFVWDVGFRGGLALYQVIKFRELRTEAWLWIIDTIFTAAVVIALFSRGTA